MGNYITFLSGLSIALIYVFLAIPNDIPNKKNSTNIFKDFFITPVIDMFKALFKRRANGLHWLIALQMLAFLFIWFSIQELEMKYLYMLKTFEGFDGVDYSHFSIYTTILNVFGLMVLMPFISRILKLHDAASLALISFLDAMSNLILSSYLSNF